MDILITSLVIVGLLYSLIRDIARPHYIFLAALLLLLVTGVLTPLEAFSGFSNEAVFTVGALFIVAAGVQNSNALNFLNRFVFTERGSTKPVLFKMMSMTAVMSAFLNNTPIVAMLIPQVMTWCEKRGLSASKFLIPLSYATIVGGTVTLIGTSTNLIISGLLSQQNLEGLGFFELTWVGIPATLLTILWFVLRGHKTLPDNSVNLNTQDQIGNSKFQFDLIVTENSPVNNLSIEKAGLRELKQAFLIHIRRKGQLIGPVSPDIPLQTHDVLNFQGDYESIKTLAKTKKLKLSVPKLTDKDEQLPLFEAVVAHSSDMIGMTLKEIAFRERFGAIVVAIQRKNELLKGALGHTPIKAGDLLLIEARADFEKYMHTQANHYYMIRKKSNGLELSSDKTKIAIIITLAMVILAATGIMPMVTASLLAAVAMILVGCIDKESLVTHMQLPILFVIATAIGLGKAVEVSGLANMAAEAVMNISGDFHPIMLIIFLYLVTNLFTEIITNNAAAVLMLPIAIFVAEMAGIPYHAAAVTVAIAASASFLTPIGYQTNLMVMAVGGYRFTDYLKAGFPVTIILLITTVVVVYWRYLL